MKGSKARWLVALATTAAVVAGPASPAGARPAATYEFTNPYAYADVQPGLGTTVAEAHTDSSETGYHLKFGLSSSCDSVVCDGQPQSGASGGVSEWVRPAGTTLDIAATIRLNSLKIGSNTDPQTSGTTAFLVVTNRICGDAVDLTTVGEPVVVSCQLAGVKKNGRYGISARVLAHAAPLFGPGLPATLEATATVDRIIVTG